MFASFTPLKKKVERFTSKKFTGKNYLIEHNTGDKSSEEEEANNAANLAIAAHQTANKAVDKIDTHTHDEIDTHTHDKIIPHTHDEIDVLSLIHI